LKIEKSVADGQKCMHIDGQFEKSGKKLKQNAGIFRSSARAGQVHSVKLCHKTLCGFDLMQEAK
jgi:hypothetical protein